jgi:hypothetical protein
VRRAGARTGGNRPDPVRAAGAGRCEEAGGGGGAPFEALAESCASDVEGTWDPFERAVRLLSLVPLRDGTDHGVAAPGQPAPDLMADEPFLRVTPGSSNPLLTAEEVSAVAGRPVEATGFQLGMLGAVYRGADLTVSLTVTRGAMGRLSYGPARRRGRALPGIGDEAWQLARDQTVVFRVGGYTGKVTVSGSAARGLAQDVPSRLATAVAARLATLADRLPGGTPPAGSFSEPPGSFGEPPGSFSEPPRDSVSRPEQ